MLAWLSNLLFVIEMSQTHNYIQGKLVALLYLKWIKGINYHTSVTEIMQSAECLMNYISHLKWEPRGKQFEVTFGDI